MGREVRRVPANWQHPKDNRGRYIALHGGSLSLRQREWDEEEAQWRAGYKKNYGSGEKWIQKADGQDYSFEEWIGQRHVKLEYMPEWADSERTHWQMYETTSEGTPISPVMESPETLARWLADNKASAFGDMTATYEQWLSMIKRGWAVSGVMTDGVMRSGVEAMEDDDAGL